MRAPGDTVARYTVVALLGRGGMGEVYEAEDTLLARRVALKLLPAEGDAEARRRMLREARAAAAFEHPNVVTVFDAGLIDEGKPEEQAYLAMELIRGTSLRAYVGAADVPLGRKIGWLCDTARALAAAHEAGLIHRDVKPDNVMVRRDGRVKVLDFGIAKRSEVPVDASAPTEAPRTDLHTLTERGAFVGTPRYASPEQLRGEALDGRADQFAWGVTAFELLSGATPFPDDQGVTLVSKILSEPPPKLRELVPDLPKVVEEVVARALARDKKQRFASLVDAADELEPLAERGAMSESIRADGAASTQHKSTVVVRTARSAARVFFWFAAGLGTLMMILILVGIATGGFHLDLNTGKSASASASASVAAPPPSGLRCGPAKVDGATNAELARVIGFGACARLGTETGLPWAHEGALPPKLDLATYTAVDVELALAGRPKVSLRVGELAASGEGASPFEAMNAAVSALSPQIAPRPLSDAERAAWGADSDESAGRIERAWRKLLLGDLEDPVTAIRALIKTDGASPWPHAMACLVERRGTKESLAACKATLDHLGPTLPAQREKALRGLALFVGESKVDEGVRLFRQAARDATDDPDVSGLYGAVVLQVAPDEGFGVVDGVAQRFPMYAVLPLSNAVTGPAVRDSARNAKYLARLTELLPEKACDEMQFGELLWDRRVAEARARLALCVGVFGDQDALFPATLIGADIALAALEPEPARALAQSKLADPREQIRSAAMAKLIAAHIVAGHAGAAETTLEADLARLLDQQDPRTALQRVVALIRLRRQLGEKIDPKLIETARTIVRDDTSAPPWVRGRIEAMLSTIGPLDKASAVKLADALVASSNPSDVFYAIPLLRLAYGEKQALAILDGRLNVATRARIVNALDYADLLRKAGGSDAALESHVRLALVPSAMDVSSLDKIVARLALAKLLDKAGKKDEAAALRAEVDAAFKGADRGLRERLERIAEGAKP